MDHCSFIFPECQYIYMTHFFSPNAPPPCHLFHLDRGVEEKILVHFCMQRPDVLANVRHYLLKNGKVLSAVEAPEWVCKHWEVLSICPDDIRGTLAVDQWAEEERISKGYYLLTSREPVRKDADALRSSLTRKRTLRSRRRRPPQNKGEMKTLQHYFK